MSKTLLSETAFTVVTIEDQLISPVGLWEKRVANWGQCANRPWTRDLIKIAAIRFTLSDTLTSYQAFIKPSRPLSEFTQQITGVTASELKEAVCLTEALQGLVDFCQDTVLVCHNAAYVLGTLAEKLQECGLPELDVPMLDTQQLARRLHPGWHRASSSKVLAKHYRLPVDDLSYADRITALFRVICQDLQVTRGLTTVADLQDFMTQNEITKSLLY